MAYNYFKDLKRKWQGYLKVALLLGVTIALLAVTHGAKPAIKETIESDMICPEGVVAPCSIGGKAGTKECIHGMWGPCRPEALPTPTPQNGTVRPKYYVLTLVYAPPGTRGGGSTSSVVYGSGSSTGTTVSASSSFKQGYSVSVSHDVGFFGEKGSAGGSFGYERDSSDSSSCDIKKSASSEISVNGPAQDGIDHNRDQIYLWLNPQLDLAMTPTSATWHIKDNPTADIQYVYVGWLKNPSQIPPGVAQRLQTYGITNQDYPEILKVDPFANGVATIDPVRYQTLNTTFPYESPFAPGDPVPTTKFAAVYTKDHKDSNTLDHDLTLGFSAEGEVGFLELVKVKFKASTSWTWSCSDTNTTADGTSESGSVTVGGPAFGYTGPTDIAIFYDVFFKTFMFAPEAGKVPSLTGSVKSSSGRAVAGREVIVVANSVRHRTFTNAKGEYRIFGRISGPLRLRVGSVRNQLQKIPSTRKADILLP